MGRSVWRNVEEIGTRRGGTSARLQVEIAVLKDVKKAVGARRIEDGAIEREREGGRKQEGRKKEASKKEGRRKEEGRTKEERRVQLKKKKKGRNKHQRACCVERVLISRFQALSFFLLRFSSSLSWCVFSPNKRGPQHFLAAFAFCPSACLRMCLHTNNIDDEDDDRHQQQKCNPWCAFGSSHMCSCPSVCSEPIFFKLFCTSLCLFLLLLLFFLLPSSFSCLVPRPSSLCHPIVIGISVQPCLALLLSIVSAPIPWPRLELVLR